ncbi:MAG: site-specific DNA-methyltransferase [Clostridia bacterium]|nr:site-specific DNA-methyltransferase [Clostridia bacterium]
MRITLYQGDCLQEIKKIPDKSVDLVLTDPPYGIDFQSNERKEKERRHDKIANDKRPFIDFIKEIPRVIKETGAVIVFSRWDDSRNS